MAIDWASEGPKYRGPEDVRAKWNSFDARRADATTLATLICKVRKARQQVKRVARVEGIQLHSVDDLLTRSAPEWLIDKTLPAQGLAVMFGDSGAGKSFLSVDLADAVSHSRAWLGRSASSGDVVYVAAEGGSGIAARFAALREGRPIQPTGQVRIVIDSLDFLGGDADRLIHAIQSAEIKSLKLVIVDTLARTMGPGDENSAKEMNEFIAACASISSSLRCLVLVVHHTGKDGSRGARGSSALRAAADTEIYVRREKSGERIAEITKQREGEDRVLLMFELLEAPYFQEVGGDVLVGETLRVSVTSARASAKDEFASVAQPQGKNQRAVLDELRKQSRIVDGAVIQKDRLIVALPGVDARHRKESLNTALEGLQKGGFVVLQGDSVQVQQ